MAGVGGAAPVPRDDATRARMRRQRTRDTACEVALRRELHRRGRRFRVDVKVEADLRTRADLAWSGRRVAVFVDGCFWHGCPEHGTTPASNRDWWIAKIEANRDRDRRTAELLRERGWTVLRFWEHVDTVEAADVVERRLEA